MHLGRHLKRVGWEADPPVACVPRLDGWPKGSLVGFWEALPPFFFFCRLPRLPTQKASTPCATAGRSRHCGPLIPSPPVPLPRSHSCGLFRGHGVGECGTTGVVVVGAVVPCAAGLRGWVCGGLEWGLHTPIPAFEAGQCWCASTGSGPLPSLCSPFVTALQSYARVLKCVPMVTAGCSCAL